MSKVVLDNTLVDDPKGLDELEERIYFSRDLSGYIREIVGQLIFTGNGFDYLYNRMITDVVTPVTVNIITSCGDVIDGDIFLTDCTIDIRKRTVSGEISVKGYMSLIDQNKQIQCNVGVGKSKNGVNIFANPITNFRIPDIDNVSANDNISRRGVYVYDAFRTQIEFMSDGQITLASDFFNYNATNFTQASLTALFTGRSLRSSAFSTFPLISFKELFDDMNAMYNLSFAYEFVSGVQYIRIEPKAYFKTAAVSAVLNGVDNVIQSMDRNSFPAKVVFGSVEEADDKTYLPDLRFLGMNEEEYHLGGQTNIDTELNLQTKTIIIDPNIIQDIVPTGTSNIKYDTNVCAVVMDLTDINRAKMTENPASAGDYYLNVFLSNENVALRWFDQIPISIYAFLGAGNNGAFVNLTSPQSAIVLPKVFSPTDDFTPPFNDVGLNYAVSIRSFPITYESSGDYSYAGALTPTLGGYYVAPISGVYNFECVMRMDYATWGRFFAIVMNPPMMGGTVAQSILLASQTPQNLPINNGVVMSGDDPSLATPDPYRFTVGSTVYMAAGQYIGTSIMLSGGYGTNSTFEVFDPLGGRWASFYNEKNYLLLSNMQYPISKQVWDNIKANLSDQIGFSVGDYANGSGWLIELVRNFVTGNTKIRLNSKITNFAA